MPRLSGKVCLVTGAARGIGLAIARAFHVEGAVVVLTDIDEDTLSTSVSGFVDRCEAHRLDVREEADWQRVINGVLASHTRLDVLVNNAGITGFDPPCGPHDPEHASLDAWREVHRTNLDGVFLGCKHAIRAMRSNPGSDAGTGSIINISSRSGVVGIPRAAAYASSKAAVRHHTKSVALYCAEEGLKIRCNSIQPAAILTPMWDAMLGTGPEREQRLAEYARSAPLNRFGTPEEVASLAVHLASDESAYTTGAEFNIDGGMLAGVANPPQPAG